MKEWLGDLLDKNPLFVTFLVPMVVDIVGTVTGQDSIYWNSHYQSFNEAAPVFIFLQISPWTFILATLAIWLSFTYLLTKKLKEPYNLWAVFALFAGHSYNSIFWLRKTQSNLGILTNHGDHIITTLALLPMFAYILLIGLIAAKAISTYFKK